jgi:hypothetical protein
MRLIATAASVTVDRARRFGQGAGGFPPVCGRTIIGPALGTALPRLNMHWAKALSNCA